jgi:chromosome segregation ATPase
MSNNFSVEELQERLQKLNEQLEAKKKVANQTLTEIENICKEMLSLQDMINSKTNG